VSGHDRSAVDRESGRPRLSDTHAHLNLDPYSRDREAVIARARDAGIEFIVNVGFNLATSRESITLAESHDFIWASVGLHPHDAGEMSDALLADLRAWAAHPKVVAIGETGLDYYRDLSPRDAQREAFRGQIRLAREVGLPLIVHNRDALSDVLAVIDEEGASGVGGVMHCFPGDADYAREVVKRGFRVGIGGAVTYSKRGRLVEVARTVPRPSLLIETDAPWLTPEPERAAARERGERPRNEPAFVATVAETIARIRGVDVGDLGRATMGNALKLFSRASRPAPSIAYEMWGNLYLNITNRCTNQCTFCLRYQSDVLWGYNLKLETEPTVEEIVEAIGDPRRYREIVFCGYGEPTVRLDVIKEVGGRLRAAGVRVRLDTNGQGSLIWKRNIAPELVEAVDAVSVSLNAGDAASYERLCRPSLGPSTFEHVVAFISDCRKAGLEVAASVVDLPGVDIERARKVAADLGVPLRVRGGGEPRTRT
jgi:TatD DNase family protein